VYSWFQFGHLLPNYYRASRLQFDFFWVALAGNLISPARGLLVYVPSLFFVSYLLVRYRRRLVYQRLVWLSLIIIASHLVVVSSFPHWWGGHSFGPRFTTDLVPWFVLLGILGLRAMLAWREEHTESSLIVWRSQLAVGGLLLLLSAFINTLGATSHPTWLWNMHPFSIDEHPERLWDWRQPQFLAQYLPIPPPKEFPPMGTTEIDFTAPEAEKYLWYGWHTHERDGRWSDNRAALVFALAPVRNITMHVKIAPFIVPGKLDEQHVKVTLNDQPLLTLVLREWEAQVYSIDLPGHLMREKNVLSFEIPDAQSPLKLGVGDDPLQRGINLVWIQFEPQNVDG
jgi:hypothetical protein